MKQLLFLIMLCIGAISTQAQQKPQYYFAPKLDDSAHLGITYFTLGPMFFQTTNTAPTLINQYIAIYEPRNFNYPPKGKITALYLWVYAAYTNFADGKYRFSPFDIRMGTTLRDSFGIGSNCTLFDEEKDLTTVISGNPYTIPDTTLNPHYNFRKWIKLPLQVPFMFDPTKNLVVHHKNSNDSNLQQTAPTYIQSLFCFDSLTLNKVRFFGCRANLKTVNNGGFVPTLLPCIGFDLDTTGVSEIEEVINTHLSLYPNPTKDNLYLSATPRPNTAYTITDITGRQLLQGVVKDNVISVQTLQPGLYLLRIGTEVLRFVKEE
jgi:hypothetical protein